MVLFEHKILMSSLHCFYITWAVIVDIHMLQQRVWYLDTQVHITNVQSYLYSIVIWLLLTCLYAFFNRLDVDMCVFDITKPWLSSSLYSICPWCIAEQHRQVVMRFSRVMWLFQPSWFLLLHQFAENILRLVRDSWMSDVGSVKKYGKNGVTGKSSMIIHVWMKKTLRFSPFWSAESLGDSRITLISRFSLIHWWIYLELFRFLLGWQAVGVEGSTDIPGVCHSMHCEQ